MEYESIEISWEYYPGEFGLHIKSTFWLVLNFHISGGSRPEIYLGIPIKALDVNGYRYTGKDISIHWHSFRADNSIFWREKLQVTYEPGPEDLEDLIPF